MPFMGDRFSSAAATQSDSFNSSLWLPIKVTADPHSRTRSSLPLLSTVSFHTNSRPTPLSAITAHPFPNFPMVIRRPQPTRSSTPTMTTIILLDATQSSSCSSTPPPASPLSRGAPDPVFNSQSFYQNPYLYRVLSEAVPMEPLLSYVQPEELHYFSPVTTSFPCVPTPDILLAAPQQLPEESPQEHHPQEYQQEHIFVNQNMNQGSFITSMSENMQPLPTHYSAELPKRKGDRALARLHRSAVDPDRHFACNQCIQKFSRKSDLTRHIKRHAGQKDYPCTAPACPLPPHERAFFRADARRRHWSRSPSCEVAFYDTPEGVAWAKKNGNRRGVLIYRSNDYGYHEDNSDGCESIYTE